MCLVQQNMEIGGDRMGWEFMGHLKSITLTIVGVVVWYVILGEFGADMASSSVDDGYGVVALKFISASFIFQQGNLSGMSWSFFTFFVVWI